MATIFDSRKLSCNLSQKLVIRKKLSLNKCSVNICSVLTEVFLGGRLWTLNTEDSGSVERFEFMGQILKQLSGASPQAINRCQLAKIVVPASFTLLLSSSPSKKLARLFNILTYIFWMGWITLPSLTHISFHSILFFLPCKPLGSVPSARDTSCISLQPLPAQGFYGRIDYD